MRHVSIGRLTGAGFLAAAAIIGLSFIPSARADEALPTETQTKSVTTNLGIYGGDTWDIAVDGNHVYTIASGVPNGFFYSVDAAASWQRPAGTNDYGSGTAVEVDPTTHAVYVALDGLYKSTDYGATLTKISDHAGFALLVAQGKVMTASNDTLYISADNGVTFSSVTIAAGRNILSLAASATAGTFYAVVRDATTGVVGPYVSTDNGQTWNTDVLSITPEVGASGYTQVNADPHHANILTLSGDNVLWLSTNAGVSWTNVGTSSSRPCGDYSVWNSSGRWYACSGYSSNNGATWTDMDVHTNVMRGPGKSVVITAGNENVLYGDCMSGVCKSTDGGLTWHNSLDGITGVNVLAISQTTNKGTVWISSSNGLGKTTNFLSATPDWTWPILPCDSRPGHRCDSSGMGESVWVKPDDANIVLAGSIGGWIYRSVDGGTTWTNEIPAVLDQAKFKTGDWNNLRPQQFIVDPSNTNIVYVAIVDPVDHNGAVLKSTNAGATWTDLGITGDAPATHLALSKTGILYVGTGEGSSSTKGMYKYTSGTWTKLSGLPTTVNINSVIVDPETQSTVYATAGADARLGNDGFFKSTDNGATWKMAAGLSGYYGFGAITVEKSTTPNTLYISCRDGAGHGVMLKSSDQGTTWGVLYTGLKSETFNTVLFDGLLLGSKHGVLSLKSRITLPITASATSLRKNRPLTFTSTLKDATTKKVITGTTVTLYRLSGKVWKKVTAAKTNAKGIVTLKTKLTATTKYKLEWVPGPKTKAEYSGARSKYLTIKLKK